MLAHRAAGLREPVVEEAAGRAAHDALDPVDRASARGGLVEAEADEVVHGPARLGVAERVDLLRLTGERVRVARLVSPRVAHELGDVTNGGKAEPDDERDPSRST